MNTSANTPLDGHLLAYYEQGWEGRIEYAFQPEGGGRWLLLEPGDQLTIFAADGRVLWAGEVAWLRPGFWERRRNQLSVWSWVKQQGVPYGQWLGWFWRQPPLKARLARGSE